ncbi:MAG: bifunctional biotin--[acetyl-CoA-carboxylase] ligase/biotin operon repressor BirA [Gammaproteobacteria bacterium]|nr:bifunctional biotin--[acetyl-CoA-carboxylase] ligase/biotin operon repressor BirA [Gammaproteobacteria bacterium]
MTSSRITILRILSDGEFHSGKLMGDRLAITRAAVNKIIQQLCASGLEIHSVTGKGYRLAEPLELLDRDRVMSIINGSGHSDVELEIHEQLESTSRYLVDKKSLSENSLVCMAEHQTAGRGRRGRLWQATPYRNILISVSQRLPLRPPQVAGLSLAIGVGIVESLEVFGYRGVKLKWPNDLMWEGHKLGGVLVDMQGESEGPTRLVVGLGLNLHMVNQDAESIDQPWVDLRNVPGPPTVSRNELAGHLAVAMISVFHEFVDKGFESFRNRWLSRNAYADKPVVLIQGDSTEEGIIQGVDEYGALLLRTSAGISAHHSGEVSLRLMK